MKISKILIYSTLLICIFCSACTDQTSPSNDEDCVGLEVEDDNKACAKVGDKCEETDVCLNVNNYGETPEICSKLKVSDGKEETHVCSKNSAADSTNCIETDVCLDVEYGATPEICFKLKVSAEKEATHVCSKNSVKDSTNCIETNECEKVLYVENDGDCSEFILLFDFKNEK